MIVGVAGGSVDAAVAVGVAVGGAIVALALGVTSVVVVVNSTTGIVVAVGSTESSGPLHAPSRTTTGSSANSTRIIRDTANAPSATAHHRYRRVDSTARK